MGLYAIPIRSEAINDVNAMLERFGFTVSPMKENEDASFFRCERNGLCVEFWITKREPPRFCSGIGKRSTEVIKLLDELGVFQTPN